MNKHTPGPWRWNIRYEGLTSSHGDILTYYPCEGMHLSDDNEENARLIAEAGTVATETGLTPRQLAEHRQDLLEALESLANVAVRNTDDCEEWEAVIAEARAAIAKAKGETK